MSEAARGAPACASATFTLNQLVETADCFRLSAPEVPDIDPLCFAIVYALTPKTGGALKKAVRGPPHLLASRRWNPSSIGTVLSYVVLLRRTEAPARSIYHNR